MSSSFAAQLDGTGSPGPGAPPATPTVPIADRFHSAPVVLQSDEHRNGAFVPAGLDRSYWDSVVSDKLDPALVAAPTSSTAHSPQQRQGQPAMPFGRPSQSIVMPASPGSAALAAGASPSPPPPNLAPPPHVPVAPGPVSQLPVANRDGPPRRDSWLSNPLPALPAHLQATMELGVHVPRPGQLEPAPSASRSANVISSGTKVRGDRQQCVQSILEPLDLPPLPAAVEGHLENANAGSPARAHPRGTYVGFEDRYEILREIGEGSYGAVYEVASRVPIAGHPKGSIFVAKRLKSTAGELGYFGPLAPERAHLQNRDVVCVLREPIVVRFLPPGHPHLVRFMEVIGKKINGCIVDSAYDSIHVQALYEFELLSDDAWIIMRNEGIDLEIYLKDFPSGLPPDLAKELMSQILLGIGAVHASKLTHRDLKPRNILIHDGRARVCDFGLARRTDVHSDTRTVMIGTAYFRSFETAMLCPDHGPASDINVAGTILVRLLTGYKVGQYFRDEHERMLERDREEGSQNNESKRYMRFVQGDPDLHVLKDCFRLFGAPVGDAEDYVIDSLKKRDPIFQLEVFACLESLRGQPPAIDALLLERGYDSSCGVRGLLEVGTSRCRKAAQR
ncbi:kinase-like domain-containing protein [Hyaloraphidium curvatum]|nr:kinase-like domain-containing protein [Hyaloraphidium curvatum]